ncbi:MAG: hypothetical protein WCF85_21115, partial [Rhodospirillaceae bacterium]
SQADYHSKRVFAELRQYLRPSDDDKIDSVKSQIFDEVVIESLDGVPSSIRQIVADGVFVELKKCDLLDAEFAMTVSKPSRQVKNPKVPGSSPRHPNAIVSDICSQAQIVLRKGL